MKGQPAGPLRAFVAEASPPLPCGKRLRWREVARARWARMKEASPTTTQEGMTLEHACDGRLSAGSPENRA